MSWATENKFLTGYIIVMALGAGALGYQVFSASSAYDAATETYKGKAQTYNNLRKQVPTPDRQNVAKLETQKNEAAAVISAFQADLAKREFPITPMSPAEFQEALRKTVNNVKTKADGSGVRLGKDREKDKFYLGFQRYEGSTPDQGVSAVLGRDLKAIEWVVDQLIETPVIAINDIKRPELPQESRKAATPPPKTAPGKPGSTPSSNLVTAHSFDISFTCRQPQLAKVLNVLVNPSAPQFLIPRSVKVVNSMPKAPAKVDPAAALAAANAAPAATPDPSAPAGQPAPAAPGAPAAPAPMSTIKYLLGEETVDATITLDIVDFAEPSAAEPAAAAKPAPGR